MNTPPTTAKDLVLISWDGQEPPARHVQLDAPAQFELLLFDYSGKAERPRLVSSGWPEHWGWLSEATACKGEILSMLVARLANRLQQCHYIGLIDDDIVISISQINQALRRGSKLGSVCFSPTLAPGKHAWVPHMVSQGKAAWRIVPWVEMKMSFVRRDLFMATAPFYPLSISSYGIDYFVHPYFARALKCPGDFHVFDDIAVVNCREDRSGSRTFANGMTAVEEGERLGRICLQHLLRERRDLLSDHRVQQVLHLRAHSPSASATTGCLA